MMSMSSAAFSSSAPSLKRPEPDFAMVPRLSASSSFVIPMPGVLVRGDLDREIAPGETGDVVRQGLIVELVHGVARVRNELAQEDLLVRVNGVDHEVQQSLGLCFELSLCHIVYFLCMLWGDVPLQREFSTLPERVLIYLVLYLFIIKKQGLCEGFFAKPCGFFPLCSGEGRLEHDGVVVRWFLPSVFHKQKLFYRTAEEFCLFFVRRCSRGGTL